MGLVQITQVARTRGADFLRVSTEKAELERRLARWQTADLVVDGMFTPLASEGILLTNCILRQFRLGRHFRRRQGRIRAINQKEIKEVDPSRTCYLLLANICTSLRRPRIEYILFVRLTIGTGKSPEVASALLCFPAENVPLCSVGHLPVRPESYLRDPGFLA